MNREKQKKNFFYFIFPKRVINETIYEIQNNTFRLKLTNDIQMLDKKNGRKIKTLSSNRDHV